AISSVWVDRQVRRSVVSVNARNVGKLLPDADGAYLSNTGVLQVDGHSMEACVAWARMARSSGIPVVLDAGSWKEGTEDLLGSVDIAVCSADFRPPTCTDEDQLVKYLLEHNTRHIAITHGAEPIRYVSGSLEGCVSVPQVEVVDTTGAGDFLH